MKITATYQGQTFTRTSKVAYTHLVVALMDGELVAARWSKSAAAAAKPLPYGWDSGRVATIELAPAAKPLAEITVADLAGMTIQEIDALRAQAAK
jgi:hypothetical protein